MTSHGRLPTAVRFVRELGERNMAHGAKLHGHQRLHRDIVLATVTLQTILLWGIVENSKIFVRMHEIFKAWAVQFTDELSG
jgi:hypothetical protein